MSGAFNSRKLETNAPAMQGVTNLEDWGKKQGLGTAGSTADTVLEQMASGQYGKLAGTMLSPIHDTYATAGRDAEHAAMTGGNALYAGTQPALMAGLQDESRRRMAEGEGLAYGQAIPQLWGQAGNMYQGALNSERGAELSALQGGLQGRLAANQYVNKPGWLGQLTGAIGGIGGAMMGIPGLGGLMGGGGGQMPMAGPTSQNIGNYANMIPSYGTPPR